MNTFLRITKKSAFALTILATVGALLTLAFALWAPISGFTLNFFDAEYDAHALVETGFFEWMALFLGTSIAYFFGALVVLFALAFGGSVLVLTLLFVALSLVLGALALVSPILVVAGLVWLGMWAVRRIARRNVNSVA